ncbi:hypothetical protein FQZ97_1088450 [compost metagenome]
MSTISDRSSAGASCTARKSRCRPALLKAPSTRPWCCRASSTRASQSRGRDTSVTRNRAWPPLARISSSRSAPACGLRLPITTLAPASAKARQASRPMPLPPPVTMITLSRRELSRLMLFPLVVIGVECRGCQARGMRPNRASRTTPMASSRRSFPFSASSSSPTGSPVRAPRPMDS